MSKEEPKTTEGMHASGGLRAGVFSVVLMLLVVFELLYLTQDLGIRADLTSEKLYSLSGSTKKILMKLEEPLVVEGYFSEKIPGTYQEVRRKLRDLLDEYVQIGQGRVKLIYLDPLEDERVREKADRLGIRENRANVLENDSLQVVTVYQGLRLRYGGDRQKVIPVLEDPNALESMLTPMIQELVLNKKPKLGFLVRTPPPNPYMREQPASWNLIQQQLRERFDVQSLDMSNGELLPEDLEVLVIFQPQDLTDWEKYCIDQHLMKGHNLIVCQEAADYSVGMQSMYFQKAFQVDHLESKHKWKDQLAAYGIETSGKLVSDVAAQMQVLMLGPNQRSVLASRMPYWLFAVSRDWSQVWKAQAPRAGDDPESAKAQAEQLAPGLDVKHPVLQGTDSLPFFWATDVGLKDPLPEGVTGSILARTSPYGLTESPPYSSRPDQTLQTKIYSRIKSEPIKQVPLAVLLTGKFSSAFKSIPERPGKDKSGGLLSQAGQADPAKKPGQAPAKAKMEEPAKSGEEEAGKAKPEPQARAGQGATRPEEKPETETPASGEPGGGNKTAEGQQPESKPSPVQGPELPDQGEEGKKEGKKEEEKKLPPQMLHGTDESRIVVIGDASMFRDDFLRGLPPFRTPNSQIALPFFMNLLDWMALDTDLVELRNHRDVDRRLEFVSPDLNLNPKEQDRMVASKKSFLRWLNVLGPVILLLGFGLMLWVKRSSERRRFFYEV
ncbi:MAG: Gldg family protein [Planctomycetota bacterium]